MITGTTEILKMLTLNQRGLAPMPIENVGNMLQSVLQTI